METPPCRVGGMRGKGWVDVGTWDGGWVVDGIWVDLSFIVEFTLKDYSGRRRKGRSESISWTEPKVRLVL
jgi:hypothetical protein